MKKSIIFLILLLPLLILSCSSSNDDEINQLQLQIIELENQKIQQELDELRKEKAEAEAKAANEEKKKAEAKALSAKSVKEKAEAEAEAKIAKEKQEKAEAEAKIAKEKQEKAEAEAKAAKEKQEKAESADLSVRKLFAIQNTIDTNIENCDSLFSNSKKIDAKDFFIGLDDKLRDTHEIGKYSFVSFEGDIARNGPFSTWVYEMLIEYSKKYNPGKFEKIKFADIEITLDDYLEYKNKLCDTYQNQKFNGTLRQLMIDINVLLKFRTDWPGHASKWLSFPYIDTGPKVIKSPSPKGLEFYTKYITGGGVIIVSGPEVDDGALLQGRKSVIYMTSKIPELRKILQDNEVRISVFTGTAGSLPEYPGNTEPGGFAMGMTDASMTANADWLCRPGNYDGGGDPVIHELVHTINHVVFEQINEIYFYERIYKIAENSINKGIFDTGFTQNLEKGQTQNMSHFVGEFWAMTVEGYMMDKSNFKNPPYDRRHKIKKVDPELYDLITRYFPTKQWDFCE